MSNSKIKPYLQPAFLVCALLLLLACFGKKAVIEYTGVILTKIPVQLRNPLDDIDRDKLAPYKVVDETKIENKDILESLGTDDYIQWTLENTDVSESSSTRYCQLFITFYGLPDRVPHVPEECYVGSGNQQLGSKSISIEIDGQQPIDIKLLVFGAQNTDVLSDGSNFSRMYFFKVNDEFANGRTGVRSALQRNLFGKYSFFSKVEWQFFGYGYGGRISPSEEQIIKSSEKLISKILPILEDQHWPIIEEIVIKENNIETNTK